MHIKSITLSGFKSYRDPVTLVLDPGHNVVIGRNGYGKSNIFDAIRFVFGDQFGAMRVEDKSRLIFDQGNAQYIQASVTITLDNSDGRLPLEGTAVTVGRTVGLKKDEFFLGGKTVKKNDIQSILESAGFSRSNPYYIVAQARFRGRPGWIVVAGDGARVAAAGAPARTTSGASQCAAMCPRAAAPS